MNYIDGRYKFNLLGFDKARKTHILAVVYRPLYTTVRKLQVCQCLVFLTQWRVDEAQELGGTDM